MKTARVPQQLVKNSFWIAEKLQFLKAWHPQRLLTVRVSGSAPERWLVEQEPRLLHPNWDYADRGYMWTEMIGKSGNYLSFSAFMRQVLGVAMDKKKVTWIEIEGRNDPIRQLKRGTREPAEVSPEGLKGTAHATMAKQPR